MTEHDFQAVKKLQHDSVGRSTDLNLCLRQALLLLGHLLVFTIHNLQPQRTSLKVGRLQQKQVARQLLIPQISNHACTLQHHNAL